MWCYLGWQTSLFVLWSTLSIILPHTLACPQESSTAGKPWCSWRVLLPLSAFCLAQLKLLWQNALDHMAYKQKFMTHSSGGWRSKGLADSVSTESLLFCVWVCVCMSLLAMMQPIGSTKTLLFSWKYLLCWLCLGFRTQKVLLTRQYFVSLYIIFIFQVLRKTLVICPGKS